MIYRERSNSVTKYYRKWLSISLILLFSVVSAACVATQPLAAGPGVSIASLTISEVQRSQPPTPQIVRWGGTIVGVTNMEDNTTQVEIVSRSLRKSGRPIDDDRSDGRFIAEFETFLDPEIYTVGRKLSVIGIVADTVDGKVGKSRYVFPRVQVSDYRYWKPLPPQREFPHSTLYDHYHNDPFWHDHFHQREGLHGRIILHH